MKPFPRTSLMSDSEFLAFVTANPVSGGKADEEIKAQEAQQAGFNAQLRSAFGVQFGNQSGILNFLNNKLTAQVNNPTGFTAPQMAALNTNNTEGAARAYASAEQATRAAEAARGGSTLPSGVEAQLTAENANAAAGQVATGENRIQLANADQQQQNYWSALKGLSGVAADENPTAYAGEATQGAGEVGTLGTEYNQTQQSQLLSTLGGIAGAGISTLGTVLSKNKGN